MYILKNHELEDFVSRKLKGITKERYARKQLEEYCKNNKNRICCIAGLRRTGKTTLMCQQMFELLKRDRDNVAFIECSVQDTMQDLYNVVKDMDCDNILIDEVSKMADFVGTASVLSDILVPMGHNIILSGTDSLAFAVVETNELFDRALVIKTTYISYKEFREILGGSIEEYLRYGGTLTDGHTIYNDGESLKKYTNTAIIDNILNTVRKYVDMRGEGRIAELYDSGDLKSAINKTLEIHNHRFVTKLVNNPFVSHDIGTFLANLIKREPDINFSQDYRNDITKQLKIVLEIMDRQELSDQDLDAVTEILIEMDVLSPMSGDGVLDRNDLLFTQPGMRYCQIDELAKAVLRDERFQQYTDVQKEIIAETLSHSALGKIMEDIILYDIMRTYPPQKYKVFRHTVTGRALDYEYDIVIADKTEKTAVLLEVKYTENAFAGQVKNFNKKTERGKMSMRDFTERTGYHITGCAVIYRGENIEMEVDGDKYAFLNVEDFLCDIARCVETIKGNGTKKLERKKFVPLRS